MVDESWDVVIVGAGTGGLNLGALLATAGKKVLLLEKQGRIGGRSVSGRRENCVLENGIHGLILSGHLDEVYRRIGKTLPPNVNTWKSSRILLDGEWRDFESLLAGSLPELERVLADAVYERSYEEIRALADISVEKFVSERTDDEGTLAWFRYMGWLYGGTKFPPTDMSAGSLFCTFKRRADNDPSGKLQDLGYMVSGGSGSISQPLADAIVENGGEIRTGTQVDKVVIENGRVRGVNVDCQDRVIPTQVLDTAFIEAPVVAAAVPLWQILGVVSEHDLPPWYVERIRYLEKKALFTWTMTYLLDAPPPFEASELMCVPKGPSSGRPWLAAVLPYAEVEGQYAVTCFFYTGWYEPPSIFEAAQAGVRAEIREKFDLFEADIRAIFPEIETSCLWRTRSVGPSSILENPGNVGPHLISMLPEGVEGLYLVGERTQEAEIQGIYGSAQVALQCADRILQT
jgi:protoporphyrinogen oxidase